LKLSKLTLSNFKGIKDFTLDADGKNVSVFGDNGTGKTTICDALYYLLFDKDSNFKKQFEIKTLSPKGIAIPGLDHEVEGTFLTDSGKTLTLKKSYKEIWTKRRGEAKKTFTGHTTDYYIDEIPVKKKEFSERSSEYFVEETFKLLTTPTYFADTLPWKDRRELLLTICGDISDDDVIDSNSELKELKSILKERPIEDHKKVIASKKAKLNDEIKQIPVRIDEATRTVSTIDFIDVEKEEHEIKALRDQINIKEKHIVRIESGAEIVEQQKKIGELDGKALQIVNAQNKERNEKIENQQIVVRGCREKYDYDDSNVRGINSEISNINRDYNFNVNEVNRLRDLWHKADNRKFIKPEQKDTCPACGQSIPEEQIKEVEEKALEEFNKSKSEAIEKINTDGTESAKKVDELDKVLEEKKAELSEALKLKADREEVLDSEKNILLELQKPAKNSKEIDEILNLRLIISEKIQELEKGTNGQTASIEKEIESLYINVADIETKLSSYKAGLETKKRIVDLENSERMLAGEIEELERQLFLIERFIIAKVELLEGNINSKFDIARFKLFKAQINGGLDECCEVLCNGIPFNSGLNNGARINVGLDIIKTLSEHFKTTAPIFIDNAESVTEIKSPDNSQVVQLVVSKDDKVLRVEN